MYRIFLKLKFYVIIKIYNYCRRELLNMELHKVNISKLDKYVIKNDKEDIENNKPWIAATPVLSGEDAKSVIASSVSASTTASIERNELAYSVLSRIRKK